MMLAAVLKAMQQKQAFFPTKLTQYVKKRKKEKKKIFLSVTSHLLVCTSLEFFS